jgi:DNA polymerase-3 subunit alpha
VVAGYSLGQADGLRKAMGKKKQALIEEHRQYFIHGKKDDKGNVIIPGGVAKGFDETKLNNLYNKIEKFGAYASTEYVAI